MADYTRVNARVEILFEVDKAHNMVSVIYL